MKKTIRALALICALCLCISLVPPAIHAAEPGPNIIRYIPEKDWDPALTPEQQAHKAHTIHWLSGVRPPRMPHELEASRRAGDPGLGDFKLEEIKNAQGRIVQSYYFSPFHAGNGWYDVNKYVSEEGSGRDSHLCFAVAMTNLLHWWLEQNRDYVERYLETLPEGAQKTALGDYLNNNLPGRPNAPVLQNPATSRLYNEVILPLYTGAPKGGYPDKPADFFFNGYPPDKDRLDRNQPRDYPAQPKGKGGLFRDVFGPSILTDYIENGYYESLNRDLKTYMDTGIGVVLAYTIRSGAHAVALWGAEYDAEGRLCAVYLTDNNDTTQDYDNENIVRWMEGMIRYDIYKSPTGPAAYITTTPDGSGKNYVTSYYPLTLAREGWAHWAETGEPLYGDGRAFLHPIPGTVEPEPEPEPKPEPPLGEPSWSVQSLEEGRVTVVNTGREDSVNLLVAGYDARGRQTFLQMKTVTAGAGVPVTVTFSDGSHHHRAFLVDGSFAPVSPAYPAD